MRAVYWSPDQYQEGKRTHIYAPEPGWMLVEVRPGGNPHDLDDIEHIEATGFESEAAAQESWLKTQVERQRGGGRERCRRALAKVEESEEARRQANPTRHTKEERRAGVRAHQQRKAAPDPWQGVGPRPPPPWLRLSE